MCNKGRFCRIVLSAALLLHGVVAVSTQNQTPPKSWVDPDTGRPELKKVDGINNNEMVQPGVFHAEKLVNMSRHHYRLEPNVRFSTDRKWVIFRSNMFGPTYTFAAEVAKSGLGVMN